VIRHRGWLGAAPARTDDDGMKTIISRQRRNRRRAFIENYEFPAALSSKLRKQLAADYEVEVALEGLREWYLACLSAPGETLGMPSRVVDIAWHEMILMTRVYHAFCDRAFGYYLHHSPEALMSEPIDQSLARTLQVLEARSLGAAAGAVPLLFAIDGQLRPEDGNIWGEGDIGRLRSLQPERWAYYGAGAGCASGGCGTGGGCGGGGCGGGGCGGGGG
jgi:uncharacterized membrane protein YgcG